MPEVHVGKCRSLLRYRGKASGAPDRRCWALRLRATRKLRLRLTHHERDSDKHHAVRTMLNDLLKLAEHYREAQYLGALCHSCNIDLIIQPARYTHYGLIKNKTGHGIRVLPEAFDDLYKEIHPGRDVPEHMQVRALSQFLWACQSSVSGVGLRFGWQAEPTKFVGATAVIIAAAALRLCVAANPVDGGLEYYYVL